MSNFKNNYSFTDNFVVRLPVFPYQTAYTGEEVKTYFKTSELFREAVFLASPILYAEADKWINNQIESKQEADKILVSLTKYLIRMSTRCTPFGLFATCSSAKWENRNDSTISDKLSRKTRFDMLYLCELAKSLEQHDNIRHALKYYPNSSIYHLGDEVRYVEYRVTNAKRFHQISSVLRSEELLALLNASADGSTIKVLADVIQQLGYSFEEAQEFVESCISSQVLTSELEPEITNEDVLQQIINILETIAAQGVDIAFELKTLQQLQQHLQELDGTGTNQPEAYRSIIENAKKLNVPINEKFFFQTDAFRKENQLSLDKGMQEDILEALHVLSAINPVKENNNLQQFAKKFYQRYEEREVPILEVLDTESGIGYLAKQKNGYSPLIDGLTLNKRYTDALGMDIYQQELFLIAKLEEAMRKGLKEIEITRDDLKAAGIDVINNDLPNSMSGIIYHLGGQKIHIESFAGSSAINVLGRFGHADEQIKETILDITRHESELETDAVIAEIVHLPESRVGNILLHPKYRKYEIPYLAKSSASPEDTINLQDILVSVSRGRIVLRSKRLKKEILPRLSNAHNYVYNAQPIYQFLCDMQQQTGRRGLSFNWFDLAKKYRFLPRVTVGNSIVSLATWTLNKQHMADFSKASKNTTDLESWLKQLGLPEIVTLVDGDNTLLVDFREQNSIQLFLDLIKKRETCILKEHLVAGGDYPFKDAKNQAYLNQLIVPIVKKQQAKTASTGRTEADVQKAQRTFSIGSEWLYFKFYCGAQISERVVAEALAPLTQILKEKGLIKEWFFLRFADPDLHLRVRFKLTAVERIGEVIAIVNENLSHFTSKKLIYKVTTDTYEREIERYGDEYIERAEEIFHHDSDSVVQVLGNIEGSEGETIRWLWGMKSVDALLNDFNLSTEEKLIFLTPLKSGFANEFNADKSTNMQINKKYRDFRNEIYDIMGSNKENEHPYQPLFEIIENRSKQIGETVIPKMRALTDVKENQRKLFDLLASFTHMHIIRLFPFQQRLHEMIIYEFLYTYYKTQLAIKNGKTKESALTLA